MWFLFRPPHGTSFPNPSPFEYDCSWRLPGSERWKDNPSCKHQPSTLKAPHALFQLSTAPNYMFLTFENVLGQQVPLSLVYCSHVITLCLPSPSLKPLIFIKISKRVMSPKGGKVGRQRRCRPLVHAVCFTAWSLCSELLCLITALLLHEKESSWVHTCIIRAVAANHCSLTTEALLAAAKPKAAAGLHDSSSRWSWQSWRGERRRRRPTQPPSQRVCGDWRWGSESHLRGWRRGSRPGRAVGCFFSGWEHTRPHFFCKKCVGSWFRHPSF